jgi:hypothetical protein
MTPRQQGCIHSFAMAITWPQGRRASLGRATGDGAADLPGVTATLAVINARGASAMLVAIVSASMVPPFAARRGDRDPGRTRPWRKKRLTNHRCGETQVAAKLT